MSNALKSAIKRAQDANRHVRECEEALRAARVEQSDACDALAKLDDAHADNGFKTLAKLWGKGEEATYRKICAIRQFFDDLDEAHKGLPFDNVLIPIGDIMSEVFSARTQDGYRLCNSPAFIDLLYQLSRRKALYASITKDDA
jgi:hypothetical protein